MSQILVERSVVEGMSRTLKALSEEIEKVIEQPDVMVELLEDKMDVVKSQWHSIQSLVDDMSLTGKIGRCLMSEGVYYLEELSSKTAREVYTIRNLGRTSYSRLKMVMEHYGVSFKR